MESLVGVLFWFLPSQPAGTCVGAQPLGVSGFPCTAWPCSQGCLPALLPSSPQLCPVHLLYVILILPFILQAALCPARVPVFLFQCAVSRGTSGYHQGSCCKRRELPFPSLAPHIHPLLCHSSLEACHTLHVNQLNECKLHQILWEKQFSLRKMTEMGLWKKGQAHARHQGGGKNLPSGRFTVGFCSLRTILVVMLLQEM